MNSYAIAFGRLPDFEVRYQLLGVAEDGDSNQTLYQHYRCDWLYDGDNIAETGIYMIWPEFLAEDSSIYPLGIPIPTSGIANMWIVLPQMRSQVHWRRIEVGVKGYFMVGDRQVAEAIVTKILGLHSNVDA